MVIATTNALPLTSISGLTWALALPVSMRKTPPSPTWLWSEDDYQCVCQLLDDATTRWGSKTLPSTCLPCRPGSCPSPDFKICMLRHRIATMAKQRNTTWVRLAWFPFLPLASTSTTLPGSPLQMYRLLIPPEKSDSLLELGTCVLASTRRCNFLVLVLALFQITYVLSVNNVYNSLVVWI